MAHISGADHAMNHADDCGCDTCSATRSADHAEGCDCGTCCAHDHGSGELHFHDAYDPTFGEPSLRPAENYLTSGGRWTDGGGFTTSLGGSGGTISWSLGGAGLLDATGQFFSGATVNMSTFMPFDFAATLQRAFDAWSAHADITFVQVADQGGDIGANGSPTIRVVGAYIDGQDGANILARAFFPTSHPAGGDIVFDSSNTTFFQNEHYFFLTALHEIGHAIGLGHEQTANAIAIMNPVINVNLQGLQPDDIAGAIAVYGATARPDLIAGNVAVSASSRAVGDTMTVTYDITNAGNATAAATTAGVYLSTDATITTDDLLVSSGLSDTDTGAGGVASKTATFQIPDLGPGTYYLGVIADIHNDEAGESNEGNNVSAPVQITVTAEDPYPDQRVVEPDGDVLTTTFDSQGRRQTFTFEDGSETRPWSRYTDTFDAEGSRTGREVFYDNGLLLAQTFVGGRRIAETQTDTADIVNWSTFTDTFDAAGNRTSRDVTYDSGLQVFTSFEGGQRREETKTDASDLYGWTVFSDSFDASGNRTGREIFYDNGLLLEQTFVDGRRSIETRTDTADIVGWSTFTDTFDASGFRTSRDLTYDNGLVVFTAFEGGKRSEETRIDESDIYVWSSFTDSFDTTGARVSRDVAFDNGLLVFTSYVNGQRREETRTDASDLFNWSTYTDTFDEGGSILTRLVSYDDGTERAFYFQNDLMFM